MILLRETFRRRRVFTWVPLHLYTEMFLHRCFYMLIRLQYTVLYAHILLHASTFTQRHFDTPWQARLHANTFTRRCSFCVRFLYIHACSVTGMPLITHALTQIFLHGDTFAQRNAFFYTQMFLQRDDLTLSNLTQKPKQTEVLLQRNACARRVF